MGFDKIFSEESKNLSFWKFEAQIIKKSRTSSSLEKKVYLLIPYDCDSMMMHGISTLAVEILLEYVQASSQSALV